MGHTPATSRSGHGFVGDRWFQQGATGLTPARCPPPHRASRAWLAPRTTRTSTPRPGPCPARPRRVARAPAQGKRRRPGRRAAGPSPPCGGRSSAREQQLRGRLLACWFCGGNDSRQCPASIPRHGAGATGVRAASPRHGRQAHAVGSQRPRVACSARSSRATWQPQQQRHQATPEQRRHPATRTAARCGAWRRPQSSRWRPPRPPRPPRRRLRGSGSGRPGWTGAASEVCGPAAPRRGSARGPTASDAERPHDCAAGCPTPSRSPTPHISPGRRPRAAPPRQAPAPPHRKLPRCWCWCPPGT